MGIEGGISNEQDKKQKELTEKEEKQESQKQVEFKKTKEKIVVEIEAENDLFQLKELVDSGVITKETAEKVIEGVDIGEETIKEIFDKIDKMEEIKDIDKYIPDELRISKEDYFKALTDDIFRVQIITKLDSALTLIANKINPDSAMGLNLFSGFLTVLDKNLILVQENTIDVKDSLKEVDEKKFGKKVDNRSLWEKIVDFLKEIIK